MRRKLSTLILVFILSGAASAQYVYQTASPDLLAEEISFYLGCNQGHDLRITGFELYLPQGQHVLTIGHVSSGGGPLTTCGTISVYSNGMAAPTVIPMSLDVFVPRYSSTRFFIESPSTIIGVNTQQAMVYSGQLGFTLNSTFAYSNGQIYGADICGRIHYAVEDGAPRGAFTPSFGGSFLNSAPGVTFDIEAHDQDLIVDGFDIKSTFASNSYSLYTTEVVDSHANVAFNPGSWRLLGGAPIQYDYFTSSSFPLPLDFEVVIPRGKRRGFYLVDNLNGHLDTGLLGGATTSLVRGNGDLSIHTGELHVTPFGPATGPGYFNCTVRYRLPAGPTITAAPSGSLSTSFSPSVGTRGIAFDIDASAPLEVGSISGPVRSTGNPFLFDSTNVELWTTVNGASHVGQLGNSSNWKLIGVMPLFFPLGGTTQNFNFSGLGQFVPEGGSRGFYLTTSSATTTFYVESGLATPGVVGTSSALSMTTGTRTTAPFVPGAAGHGVALSLGFSELGRADRGFHENFETANGLQPAAGWLVSREGATTASQGWRFDNPGGRIVDSPMTGKSAIVDANYSGSSNSVSTALYSPRFDASRDLDYELQFDSRFVQGGTDQGFVEVWDGTTWNLITTHVATQSGVTHQSFDIGAAAGGHVDAMIRFRYQGNGNQYWMIDNVGLGVSQRGQRPQLGIGEFDVNYATDPVHGQSVRSGLPGPYTATASVLGQTIFHWEGEPNQPIQLFAGYLNLGNVVLYPQGQLDVGSYDPMTGTFPGIYMLADGTLPDIFNAAFRTSSGGELTVPIFFPPYLSGFTINMQSVIFSSTQNIALTNVVTLSII
ncbi:MAG: hypothetical protein H6807_17260 [Planctomycetes bacterium]|nr:hypothetical protein [Planctomycetota bacterium]